jgi:hypothetical protein
LGLLILIVPRAAAVVDKPLWAWLQLLVVPAVLAVGGYLFIRSENRRAQELAERRAQDEALQAYLDQIGQLLLDKDRPFRQAKEGGEVQTLAQARTLAVLTRLDGERRGTLVRFLYDAGLISPDFPVIDLYGADLREASLGGASLQGVQLGGANLSGATLAGANLSGFGLSGATLGGFGRARTTCTRPRWMGPTWAGRT